MKAPSVEPVRCAIYTRVSTEHPRGVPHLRKVILIDYQLNCGHPANAVISCLPDPS